MPHSQTFDARASNIQIEGRKHTDTSQLQAHTNIIQLI